MSGADFTSNAGYGVAAMNAKTNFIGSGAQIAALVAPLTGRIAICNATGNGFVKGVVYEYNGSAWIGVAGDIVEMLRNYLPDMIWINEPFPRHELWSKATTGATVSNNDTDGGFQISTGTTTDNRSTISKNKSSRIKFGANFTILGKIDISSSQRLLFRYGVGMRVANNFSDLRRHIGLEIDNNTDVNANMFGSSSNGSTVSSSDTGQVGTGVHTWRIDFRSGIDMKVYRDGGAVILTKTTNIPSSGDTDSGGVEAFVIVGQTRNTTSKTIKFEYIQCAGEEAQTF